MDAAGPHEQGMGGVWFPGSWAWLVLFSFFPFFFFFFFLVDWDLNQSSVPAKQPLDPHL
jgi:hypothetical protein